MQKWWRLLGARAFLLLLCAGTTVTRAEASEEGDALFAVVTGQTHSGTTILSMLIKNAPGIFGGFECGIMLAKEPSDFRSVQPHYEWMMATQPNHVWNISQEDMDNYVTTAPTLLEMYDRVRRASPVLRKMPGVRILDKTPQYNDIVLDLLAKTPASVPFVISYKHRPLSVYLEARERYPNRVLLVRYESLLMHPNRVMSEVYHFLGLGAWDSTYLQMTGVYGKLEPIMGDCWARKVASEFAFAKGQHTPGSKGHETAPIECPPI